MAGEGSAIETQIEKSGYEILTPNMCYLAL